LVHQQAVQLPPSLPPSFLCRCLLCSSMVSRWAISGGTNVCGLPAASR
jgi:hypothetical protein